MTQNNDHDHDPADHTGENGAVTPAPSGGALAALTSLGTMLNRVDTASVAGRSGLPMLTFKREGDGTWAYGQKKTVVEDDSLWAVNPLTFKRGYICFGLANKVLGEILLPVSQPMPEVAELPDHGFEWQEEWAVNMKCLSGADAGVEVTFKTTTTGGAQAVAGLIDTIRDRINGGQHDGKISPIVHLEKDSYQKPPYGKVWFPVMAITDWMSLDSPATAPTPPPPPTSPTSPPPPPTPPTSPTSAAEQPRRRRVA